MSKQDLEWCGVSVIMDDATTDLFAMSTPNEDPDQKPVFLVTNATAALVKQDFELYKPSLERMANDWQEEKKLFMQAHKASN